MVPAESCYTRIGFALTDLRDQFRGMDVPRRLSCYEKITVNGECLMFNDINHFLCKRIRFVHRGGFRIHTNDGFGI